MRVTTQFGIAGPVPFVDVHIERDNLLFLDPSAIRNDPSPLGLRAHAQLISYFGEVLRCRQSAAAVDQAKGLDILQQLHEPNETRLGMSSAGVQGHGWGDELGERLWIELQTNRACQAAALTRLEDLKLFIDKVGDDLVSDMTTRVIFDVLADFTQDMMLRYPALGAATTNVNTLTWDAASLTWVTATVSLPDVAPHPLLLVPKGWVYWRMLMDDTAFYNRFATTTVQDERAVYDSVRKVRVVPMKRSLHEEFPGIKQLNNQQAAKNMQSTQGRDLVAEYRVQVDHEFEPLSDGQIEDRTS